MKPETLKREVKKIDWIDCKDYTLPSMPMSQGLLIKHIIEEYKIPFKAVGYNLDVVAIKTKKQIMAWKDTGIGARFLGLINLDDNSVYVSESDSKKQNKVFNSFKELSAEIRKRDYNNIKGLKANITEKDYQYFLEVLPPFKMGDNWFILSEALSDNLYYKFISYPKQNIYVCEVVELEDEIIMECERER